MGSRVVLVVDSEGVDGLVDERAQPRVGGPLVSTTIRLALVSHQPPAVPAIGSNETVYGCVILELRVQRRLERPGHDGES